MRGLNQYKIKKSFNYNKFNFTVCSNLENCIHPNQGKLTKKDFSRYCQCTLCEKNKNKQYGEKNKDRLKEYNKTPERINQRYKIEGYKIKGVYFTNEDYNNLLKKQKGKCACCGSKDSRRGKENRFAVDHCHKTKEVRGLLCMHCNQGIGKLGDNIEGIKKALNYLEKFK